MEDAIVRPPIDYPSAPDAQLQALYHNKDPRSLEELWGRHESTIRRWTDAWTRPDTSWADDAVQDLFLHLSQSNVQEAYDSTQPWLRWCLAVLRHRIEDERRRRGRRPAQLQQEAETSRSRDLSPEEEAALHELERELQECIDRVAEPYRTVLTLHLAGLDLTAIAERLGIAYGTAGARLHHARQQVRECLEAKGLDGGNS
jgi:RNA polymerase sigma factor (sigma-70 family)